MSGTNAAAAMMPNNQATVAFKTVNAARLDERQFYQYFREELMNSCVNVAPYLTVWEAFGTIQLKCARLRGVLNLNIEKDIEPALIGIAVSAHVALVSFPELPQVEPQPMQPAIHGGCDLLGRLQIDLTYFAFHSCAINPKTGRFDSVSSGWETASLALTSIIQTIAKAIFECRRGKTLEP